MAKQITVGISQKLSQKLNRDWVDNGTIGSGVVRARATSTRSTETRHKRDRPMLVVDAQVRKSLLVWGLLLCGIFLGGQMIGRTPRYWNEKSFANEATLTTIQSGSSDSFRNRGGWLRAR